MGKIPFKISFVYLCFALLISGCVSEPTTDASTYVPPPSGLVPEYRIGIDDMIQVNVWRNPDLGITVPVRPDGKISVPLVGDVQAGGLAPVDVAQIIKLELSKFVRDPHVTVIVSGLRSHEFLTRLRVTGAVNQPTSLNFRQGMTVLDAILIAGGVNDFAAPNRTKLYRKEKKETIVISIPLNDILYEGELSTNIELRPGDVITAPERLF
ncbi:MAG: polysaccharide biosynthesis/export family protein [Gammaproteobacteria bacterium]|nr:polysaccharide biosynthesis/export family protein [Gammaproteobacteria bacterium]